MPVSRAQLDQLSAMESAAPEYGRDLSALQSLEEVIAWVVSDTRSSGDSEADAAELFVRFAQLTPDEVRSAGRVLRRLGYVDVGERLAEVAGRRKHSLAPLP